jgi:hypothetical protein
MRYSRRIAGVLIVLLSLQMSVQFVSARPQDGQAASQTAAPQAENELIIRTDSNLPDTHPGAAYMVRLDTVGGVPRLRWQIEKGNLPPGIRLAEDGVISGSAQQGGEFQFTVVVRDSGSPPQTRRKDFVIHVRTGLTLVWRTPAHVDGNRIDGSVAVSNNTADDVDLTYIVLAVAGNGRATAIGYQHFPLAKDTVNMELPFGDTLPRGAYVVHIDAVGEVAAKKLIYRERLQTPKPLQVTVGP